jgi:hypothetical protein
MYTKFPSTYLGAVGCNLRLLLFLEHDALVREWEEQQHRGHGLRDHVQQLVIQSEDVCDGPCPKNGSWSGLPDGIFSNPKSQFE